MSAVLEDALGVLPQELFLRGLPKVELIKLLQCLGVLDQGKVRSPQHLVLAPGIDEANHLGLPVLGGIGGGAEVYVRMLRGERDRFLDPRPAGMGAHQRQLWKIEGDLVDACRPTVLDRHEVEGMTHGEHGGDAELDAFDVVGEVIRMIRPEVESMRVDVQPYESIFLHRLLEMLDPLQRVEWIDSVKSIGDTGKLLRDGIDLFGRYMQIGPLMPIAPTVKGGYVGPPETHLLGVAAKLLDGIAAQGVGAPNILKYRKFFLVFEKMLLDGLGREQMTQNIDRLAHDDLL